MLDVNRATLTLWLFNGAFAPLAERSPQMPVGQLGLTDDATINKNMKVSHLIASVVLMSPALEAVAKDVGYYEFKDPEDSLHLIILTIDGRKVTGSVTKYIGGFEAKLGKLEAKFNGKVLAGDSKKGRKLEISIQGDNHNLDFSRQNKAVWVVGPNGNLKVPVLLPIGRQPYRAVETFYAQDYH